MPRPMNSKLKTSTSTDQFIAGGGGPERAGAARGGKGPGAVARRSRRRGQPDAGERERGVGTERNGTERGVLDRMLDGDDVGLGTG